MKTAPCVTPMAVAMSPVVIRAGLGSRASRKAVATISAWRTSVDNRVCMVERSMVSDQTLTTMLRVLYTVCRIRRCTLRPLRRGT